MTKVPFGHGVPDLEEDVIVMWPYSADSVPEGWLLCDGNNGTPNLFNRFPRCISSASNNPGSTGGSNSLSLSTSQIPSHDHAVSVSSTGSHNHSVGGRTRQRRSSYTYGFRSGSIRDSDPSPIRLGYSGTHSHSGSTSSSGSGNSIDNRPASREFHFIMKA